MTIIPKEFQAMPGSSALFFCKPGLPVEWIACNISSRSFKTKSLPENTFVTLLHKNRRALVINDIIEDNYGSYCCKYENSYLGQYFIDWAYLVKGNMDEKKNNEFRQTLPQK